MIIGIIGLEGTGKTMLGCIFATLLKKEAHYKVVSNVQSFVYRDYDFETDFAFLFDKQSGIKPEKILAFVDEITQYLDSRESLKPINRKLTKKLFQVRKKGIDMIYTAQIFNSIDKRLRAMTEYIIMPDYDELHRKLTFSIIDYAGQLVTKKTLNITESVFALFNTYEDINGKLNLL